MKGISLASYGERLTELEAAYFAMNSYITIAARISENGNVTDEQIELWADRVAEKIKQYEFTRNRFYRDIISKMPESSEFSKWEINFDERLIYFS